MSEAGTCSPHDSHVGEGAKRVSSQATVGTSADVHTDLFNLTSSSSQSCPNQGLGSDGGSTPVTSHNAGSQHLV